MLDVAYRTADVDGLTVFYRESGPAGAPTLLLLHGYPSASHQFRELIPLLADRFHVLAPDLPGFGKSDMPPREEFGYTFEHLAGVIDRWTEVVGLERFALYVFDYGAPVGFRIAGRHPERVSAIITQNGNAYEEGLSDAWSPIQAYWKDPSPANRDAVRVMVRPDTTVWQYTQGVPDPARVSPDGTGSTTTTSPAPATMRSSLTCSSTTRATWRSTRRGRSTSAPAGRRCWRSGGRTTRSSCPPGPRRSSATSQAPTSASSTPATSPWKPTWKTSPPPSASSSAA
jgi:pimeloyl-ACP methyl ester carboxylesterase